MSADHTTLRGKPGVKPGSRRQVFTVRLAPAPAAPPTPDELRRWQQRWEAAKADVAARHVEKYGPLDQGRQAGTPAATRATAGGTDDV